MTDHPSGGPLAAADVAGVLSSTDSERISLALHGRMRPDGAALIALEGALAGARRLEDRTSAAAVLPAVAGQRDVLERLAGAARGVRSAAVGLVSEIYQYLGWLHLPQDDFAGALHHLKRAALLALEADDPVRLATALSFRAYAHQRSGDSRQAATLATAAARNERIYPGLRTYLHFQRAEILACQGERRQASQLLVQADRLVARLPQADELPESGYWYVPAFFLGERAFVLDALGETAAAHESATACLSELPTEWRDTEWASERRALAEKGPQR
ncbi:XRE family transcriptional regulator [Saccharopolyspora sp. SCSIO 74807]|uniref:XRE family transcriptional regulator n=1 Tax=Saccharopolyspora sp. SCSIO 74807 TaxID=3118084 RepID=UPI0030D1A2A5